MSVYCFPSCEDNSTLVTNNKPVKLEIPFSRSTQFDQNKVCDYIKWTNKTVGPFSQSITHSQSNVFKLRSTQLGLIHHCIKPEDNNTSPIGCWYIHSSEILSSIKYANPDNDAIF